MIRLNNDTRIFFNTLTLQRNRANIGLYKSAIRGLREAFLEASPSVEDLYGFVKESSLCKKITGFKDGILFDLDNGSKV